MDLDAMHANVNKLKSALQRMEGVIAFVEGLKAGGFDPGKSAPGAVLDLTDAQRDQVRDQFAEIIKPISEGIDIKLNSFDDRLRQLEGGNVAGSAANMSQRLDAIESSALDGEIRDRLESMLTWFDANREGLELLLAFDGDVDQPNPQTGAGTGIEAGNPQTGGSTSSGGASGLAETASGSVSGAAGTEAPAGAAPLAGDPATAAEASVAEPVAGRDQV